MKNKGRVIRAWADVGSHGGIFEFAIGPVADRYPHLMHIYSERVTPDLVPVEIRVERPERKRKKDAKRLQAH